MAKNDGILGIDVRHGKLSLSMIKGGNIQKTVWTDIPENIVDDCKILSDNLFSEFLKDKIKENGFKAKKAAYVIADSDLLLRSFDMPEMADDQLKLNIPFEFSDYIPGDMKDYIFDFVRRDVENEGSQGKANIIAYAVPVEYIRKICETLRLAGLKLERAVPETLVYETLLNCLQDEEDIKKETCFLDIGSNHIIMRIFRDGDYRLSHIIDIGEDKIIQAVADELNVDVNLAETYLRSNYNECQDCRSAVNAYKDISLEIMKGLNYYDMSDMTSSVKDVVLSGPGSLTDPLVALLQERIDKAVYTVQEMFPENLEVPGLNVSFASVTVIKSCIKGIGIEEEAAYADVKKKDWRLLLACAVAAIVALVFLVKVGIVDKYAELNRALAYESELQGRVAADNMFIEQSEELFAEYYHYTWDDMTEEEVGRVSRVDVAELADFIVSQGVSVRSLNLSGTTLVVGVTGDSLKTMSRLTAALTDQDIVESCSLSMAQKETLDGTENVPDTVKRGGTSKSDDEDIAEEDSQVDSSRNESEEALREILKPAPTEENSDISDVVSETEDLDDIDAADDEDDNGSSDSIVNAEINIYLTTLDAENSGEDQ